MKNFDENELIDKAMAGRLNADEQRLWQGLLAERPELEAELQIGRALRAMPPPPAVSSNFTALVMAEINKPAIERPINTWANWLRWPRLMRLAGVAVVVLGVSISVMHQRRAEQRVAAVEALAGGLNVVAAKPNAQPETVVTLLQDFEAIRRLPSSASDVDSDLLTALRSDQ